MGTGAVGSMAGMSAEAVAASAAASAAAAATQAVITQATIQLANSVITGNKLDLDLEQLVTSAVSAGVLEYANLTLGTNALTDDMNVTDYAKNATINGVGQGIQSEIRGDDFKDGFITGSIVSLVNDSALQMRKYQKENYDYPGKPKYDANGELIPGSTDVPENVGSVGLNNDGVRTAGAFPEKAYTPTGELRPKPIEGPTGGYINGDRKIFGYLYPEDGAINYILESFGGVHDRVSSWNYENINNVTYIKDNSFFTGTLISGALLIPSTPFAVGTIMQDNYQYIQDIRHFLKENKETRKDAKDNK